MSKRLDEQIKLTANLLNASAASCFTIGVLGPIVAVAINLGDAAVKVGLPALAINAAVWLSAGFALHVYARLSLRKLSE